MLNPKKNMQFWSHPSDDGLTGTCIIFVNYLITMADHIWSQIQNHKLTIICLVISEGCMKIPLISLDHTISNFIWTGFDAADQDRLRQVASSIDTGNPVMALNASCHSFESWAIYIVFFVRVIRFNG